MLLQTTYFGHITSKNHLVDEHKMPASIGTRCNICMHQGTVYGYYFWLFSPFFMTETESGFELNEGQSINRKIHKIQINIYLILTKYQRTNINFCSGIFKNWDINIKLWQWCIIIIEFSIIRIFLSKKSKIVVDFPLIYKSNKIYIDYFIICPIVT